MMKVWAALSFALLAEAASAGEICTKKSGCFRDEGFACTATPENSFIRNVCYSGAAAYLVVTIRDDRYSYCGIDQAQFYAFMAAPSAGRFFNANIKPKECERAPVSE